MCIYGNLRLALPLAIALALFGFSCVAGIGVAMPPRRKPAKGAKWPTEEMILSMLGDTPPILGWHERKGWNSKLLINTTAWHENDALEVRFNV